MLAYPSGGSEAPGAGGWSPCGLGDAHLRARVGQQARQLCVRVDRGADVVGRLARSGEGAEGGAVGGGGCCSAGAGSCGGEPGGGIGAPPPPAGVVGSICCSHCGGGSAGGLSQIRPQRSSAALSGTKEEANVADESLKGWLTLRSGAAPRLPVLSAAAQRSTRPALPCQALPEPAARRRSPLPGPPSSRTA